MSYKTGFVKRVEQNHMHNPIRSQGNTYKFFPPNAHQAAGTQHPCGNIFSSISWWSFQGPQPLFYAISAIQLSGSQVAGIRVSFSDKGWEFVVVSSDLDKAITKCYHGDIYLYHTSSVLRTVSAAHKTCATEASLAGLSPAVVSRLEPKAPSCSVLCLLAKTHNFSSSDDVASGRPICG